MSHRKPNRANKSEKKAVKLPPALTASQRVKRGDGTFTITIDPPLPKGSTFSVTYPYNATIAEMNGCSTGRFSHKGTNEAATALAVDYSPICYTGLRDWRTAALRNWKYSHRRNRVLDEEARNDFENMVRDDIARDTP